MVLKALFGLSFPLLHNFVEIFYVGTLLPNPIEYILG